MAGYTNARTKLAEASAELERVKAENVKLKRALAEHGLTDAAATKRKRVVSRDYDDSIIDELIEWSDDGLFLDECYAAWGIDADRFAQWVADHVELAAALGPARARAKASMLRTLREALKTRTAFPTSLADRIIAMVERENGASDQDGEQLVQLSFCPRCAAADGLSADGEAQVIDLAST